MTMTTRQLVEWSGRREFENVNQAWEECGKLLFDIGRRTFFNWVGEQHADRGVGPRRDGRYHIDDIVTLSAVRVWSLTSFARRVIQEGGGGAAESAWSLQKEQAEARLAWAKAEKAEDELKKSRGELVERSRMEAEMASFAVVVGAELEGMVYRLAPELLHMCGGAREKLPEVQQMLLDGVHEVQNLLAAGAEYEVEFAEDESESCPGSLTGRAACAGDPEGGGGVCDCAGEGVR
jgi:autonomous glycyl radical cofactor GrcA